ncbi:MAG: RHS repeat-associated core domain-containing protein, partial [Armatimonadetes bacterium]|nr:RHS repeat-associated core domain-containing protein [Armatimonadota bacterium]
FDPQGCPAERLDGSGAVLSHSMFAAYGYRQSTDGLPPLQAPDPFGGYGGQAGYQTDDETGLALLGHRFYDPAARRFLTRDPLGYAGGTNLYAYCADDPVNLVDPSGLCPGNGDGGGLAGCRRVAPRLAGHNPLHVRQW